MDPVIQFSGVSKRYRRNTALDELTLEVPSGVVFALLGENGAGKTTAIRIMLGLTDPDLGSARVLGFSSSSEGEEIRRRVGYVPEQPPLYDWMTVEETGWFAAGFFGNGFLPRYRKLAKKFTLDPRRRIKELSKGMRAKVALSLAMAGHPELLVLDEPTSGLDAIVRREFLESMVDIAAEGRTVFLSSHQIVEVERVADVVAILREGRLLLVEPLEDLKADTHSLVLTLRDGATAVPDLPGQVLSQQSKGRQCQALARGLDDTAIAALRANEAVRDLEVTKPALEEIFVAYMRQEMTEKIDA